MKGAFFIYKVFAVIILLADLFLWAIYHASGHKIPLITDLTFAGIGLAAILLIIFLNLTTKPLKS